MSKIVNFFKKKLEKLDPGSSNFSGTGERLGNRDENEAEKARARERALQELEMKRQQQLQMQSARASSLAGGSDANTRAAQAALQRMEMKHGPRTGANAARSSAQIDLERQRRELAEARALAERFAPKKEIVVEKPNAITRVLFTCEELFGGSAEEEPLLPLPKDALLEQVVQYCRASILSDPEAAPLSAVLMLHTCNPPARVAKCSETLTTILNNAKAHPGEEKYRKLRCQNKRLADEVFSLTGAIDFLQAVGFVPHEVPRMDAESTESNNDTETVLILPLDVSEEFLTDMLNVLSMGQAVPFKLYRDTRAFKITGQVSLEKVDLPDSFFAITEEEMRKEYAKQQKIVEESGILMTKAMRERLEQKELRRYNYCLVRVRFPDSTLLQGTFEARETMSNVMEWMSHYVKYPHIPFQLHSFSRPRLHEAVGSLAELKLTPMVLMNFSQLQSDGKPVSPPYLCDRLLSQLIPL